MYFRAYSSYILGVLYIVYIYTCLYIQYTLYGAILMGGGETFGQVIVDLYRVSRELL